VNIYTLRLALKRQSRARQSSQRETRRLHAGKVALAVSERTLLHVTPEDVYYDHLTRRYIVTEESLAGRNQWKR
jgi:hypothetical protein